MQIMINAPDNLPQAIIQQQIKELETRLFEQAKRLNHKANKAAKESKTSQQAAEAFFNTLQPLESFADVQPEQWVENIRSNSRIFR